MNEMRFIWRFCLISFVVANAGTFHWFWIALAATLLVTSLHNSVVENVIMVDKNDKARQKELLMEIRKLINPPEGVNG